MRSLRTRKSMYDGLSPWQAKPEDNDDSQMTEFCHKALPKLKPCQTLCDKINEQFQELHFQAPEIKLRIKRPVSNVQSNRQSQRKTIFNRLSVNNNNRQMKSASKPPPPQIKFEAQPLQEISLRNYVIQGSRQCPREMIIRKKQSSYVMKQKFAQIRRSMNLQLGIWGSVNKSNSTTRQPRCENKENLILKHLRYELN